MYVQYQPLPFGHFSTTSKQWTQINSTDYVRISTGRRQTSWLYEGLENYAFFSSKSRAICWWIMRQKSQIMHKLCDQIVQYGATFLCENSLFFKLQNLLCFYFLQDYPFSKQKHTKEISFASKWIEAGCSFLFFKLWLVMFLPIRECAKLGPNSQQHFLQLSSAYLLQKICTIFMGKNCPCISQRMKKT